MHTLNNEPERPGRWGQAAHGLDRTAGQLWWNPAMDRDSRP